MPLNIQKTAAFDVETKGVDDSRYALQPHRLRQGRACITSYALAWVSDTGIKTVAEEDPTYERHRAVLQWAIDNSITLVGWNMAFDVAWLIAQGHLDLVRKVKWLDAMLLWQHLEREPEYEMAATKKKGWGLKSAVAHYFPKYADYGEGIDFQSDDPAIIKKRLNYNKMDVMFTLKLAQIFYNELEDEGGNRLRNALIEADAIEPVADSMVNGLTVDMAWAHQLDVGLEDERDTLEEKLAEHGATPKILASPVRLRKLLYEDWGLPVLKKTDKGAPSTDKEALYMMAAEDDRAPLVQRYREIKGNRTKFVDNVMASVAYNEDGQTRPAMRIYGTYTGRATFSSAQGKNKDKVQTGFALHQMKNDPDYRRIITVPEGYTLIEWDAASQEYRWMAIESGDDTMLSLCMPGQDPHSFMGAQIGRVEYEWLMENKDTDKDAKKIRKGGKVGNLSCLSGDTEILTDSGFKPILLVTLADKVWDGHEFVSHDGVVCNGYREVITYQGLTATPDHQVLCRGHWVSFGIAAERGWSIDTASWSVGHSRITDSQTRFTGSDIVPLCMRRREDGSTTVPSEWSKYALQVLRQQGASQSQGAFCSVRSRGCVTSEASEQHAEPMLQPERRVLQKLRGSRNRVQVLLGSRSGGVHKDTPASRIIRGAGYRQEGQQRSLRTGELEASVAPDKLEEHTSHRHGGVERSANICSRMERETLCNYDNASIHSSGADRGGNTRQSTAGSKREAQGVERHSEKIAVYDILNCGPRNQFGANGLIVHNCQYRIGIRTLRVRANVNHGLPINDKEAGHIHRTYHSTYKGVQQYWRRQINKCRRLGYAETIAGRRVQLKGSWLDKKTGWKLESTAVNFPIQGIGADQKYLAIKLLRSVLPQVGGHFYFELHDGLYAILPSKTAMRDGLRIREMLSNMPYQKAWGFTPPVPMPWDMKIGPNWGDLKEVE